MRALLCLLMIPFSYADDFLDQVKSYLEQDPKYQEISSQLDYQQALYRGQISNLVLPELDLNISDVKKMDYGSSEENTYRQSSLSASLSLFHFGSDWKNFEATKNQLNAFKEELTENLINREKAIISLLMSYIAQKNTIEIRKKLFDLKQKVYDISKKRYSQGSLSKNDLIKVEIDVSNAKSELLVSQREILLTENKLEGYKIKTYPQSFPWENIISDNKVKSMLTWESDESRIPQVKKLKLSALRFESKATADKLSHLGNISWNYSRNLYQDEDDDQYGWSTSLVYTLPLFEKFSRDSRVQLSKARARAAKTLYHYQKELWKKQLSNAKRDLELSYADFKNRIKILKNAESLFQSSTRQFKKGRLSVNELLVEQDRLLKTKILTNNAKRDLHLGYMNYYHSFGVALTEDKHARSHKK